MDRIPEMTANVVALGSDPPMLKKTWLSLLACKGSMIFNETVDAGTKYWVGTSSENCVMGLQVTEMHHGDTSFLRIATDEKDWWKQLNITSVGGWLAQDIKAVPPNISRKKIPPSLAPGITLMPLGRPIGIAEFAAREGFRGITVANLKKLFTELQVPVIGKRPTTEAAVVRELIEFLHPDATEEETKAMCLKRHTESQQWIESITDAQDMDAVAECMDEGEADEIEQTAQTLERKRSAAAKAKSNPKPNTSSNSSSSRGPAASSGNPNAAAAARREVNFEGMSATEARSLIPQVKGCKLSMDPHQGRWQGWYPKTFPPYSVSQAVSIDGPEQALRYVVRTLWTWHQAAGNPGPDFDP